MRSVCQKGISITNSGLIIAIFDFCDISSKDVVLDVGCGRGYLTGFMDKYAGSVIGTDLNFDFLLQAKGHLVKAVMAEGRLPFSENSFDKVILFHVVEHLDSEEFQALMVEIDRVVKSGGHIVVGIPIRGCVSWLIWKFRSTFLNRLAKDHFGAEDHRQFYTYREFIEIFEKNHFKTTDRIKNIAVSNSFGFLSPIAFKAMRFLPLMLDTVNKFERVTPQRERGHG